MKHTLTLLTALLLASLTALHAAPPDARIVIASEAGAKLDSDVTKGGGTDNTALIQGILDRAPQLGSLKLVVDGAILVTGLKVHSNTTIECLNRACGFFLAVLALIWGPVRAAAAEQGAQTAALYNKLLGILTVLWFIYPVLWILGTEGTSTISLNTEVAVFTVIDLTAKVGFGLLLVTGIKKMSGAPAAAEKSAA